MKSDLKKHELLKLLSINKQSVATPLGVGFSDILESMKVDREYLNFISGELYGNDEIGYFNDGINPRGLYAEKSGVTSYSSEKYKRLHFKERWILVRNWVALILAIFSIPFQIYRYMDSKESIKTQQEPQSYELPTVTKQSQTEQDLKKESNIEENKDSLKTEVKP
jgi:hypothetical protein